MGIVEKKMETFSTLRLQSADYVKTASKHRVLGIRLFFNGTFSPRHDEGLGFRV